ncbi:heparan sulfate glucosamine 3-O-sulfotransferase 4-like [Styela clava]
MTYTKKLMIQIVVVASVFMASTYMISQRRKYLESRLLYSSIFDFDTNNEMGKKRTNEPRIPFHERELLWKKYTVNRHVETSKRVADVIGLGVKKCGTGALVHFLAEHPLIKLPRRVETFFFVKKHLRGIEYYKKIMPPVADDELAMEKTPLYFYMADRVIPYIKELAPNAKLILCLCNPAKRAFSDYVHGLFAKNKDKDGEFFAEQFEKLTDNVIERITQNTNNENDVAVKAKTVCRRSSKSCVVTKGIYHNNAQKWLKNFNSSQLLIINGDEWITDPGNLIEEIEDFLGIPKLILKEDFVLSPENGFYCLNRWWIKENNSTIETDATEFPDQKNENIFCLGSGKGRTRNGVRSMFPKTYEKLRNFYKSHNTLLYNMLNKTMQW